MNLSEYLQKNISPEVLKEIEGFHNSEAFKKIEKYSSSENFKLAKQQLKIRDAKVHKTILADIERLQNNLVN